MVFAVLFEQFFPSHRGLTRNHKSLEAGNDVNVWQQRHYESKQTDFESQTGFDSGSFDYQNSINSISYDYHNSTNSLIDQNLDATDSESESSSQPNRKIQQNGVPKFNGDALPTASTRPKRKRCKASKCLASMASDFDVITDWMFYIHCLRANEAFSANSSNDGDQTYLIPPYLVWLVLTSCIMGTMVWLVLAVCLVC